MSKDYPGKENPEIARFLKELGTEGLENLILAGWNARIGEGWNRIEIVICDENLVIYGPDVLHLHPEIDIKLADVIQSAIERHWEHPRDLESCKTLRKMMAQAVEDCDEVIEHTEALKRLVKEKPYPYDEEDHYIRDLPVSQAIIDALQEADCVWVRDFKTDDPQHCSFLEEGQLDEFLACKSRLEDLHSEVRKEQAEEYHNPKK